jgi:hypothetical protein
MDDGAQARLAVFGLDPALLALESRRGGCLITIRIRIGSLSVSGEIGLYCVIQPEETQRIPAETAYAVEYWP